MRKLWNENRSPYLLHDLRNLDTGKIPLKKIFIGPRTPDESIEKAETLLGILGYGDVPLVPSKHTSPDGTE